MTLVEAVVEIPLLYETGGEQLFDAVVVVTASEQTRRERVGDRLAQRSGRLIPDEEKVSRADYAYVKTAWDAENALPRAGRNFQRAVVDFWRPVSVNPSNSLRVGDFYSKLTATSHADCDADTRAAPYPNVAALRVSAMALDRNDRRDVWHNLEMARAIPVHIKSRVRREISRILSL